MSTVQVPKKELVSRARTYNAVALWFAENLDAGEKLRSKFAERYVAVRNSHVIDSNKDLRRLLARLGRKYSPNEVGATFIEYVTRTKINLII